jgi:cytochrome c2
MTELISQILTTIVFALLSSTAVTIKSGVPIWELEFTEILILFVFSLAFFVSLCLLKLRATTSLLTRFYNTAIIISSVFGVALFCLYMFKITPSRLGLLSTIFSSFLLLSFINVIDQNKLKIIIHTMIITSVIGINLVVDGTVFKPVQEVTERFIWSSLYDLKARHYKHPISEENFSGGGIAGVDEGYLLATARGTLFVFNEPEEKEPISVKKLKIRIPINYQKFQDHVGKGLARNFRVTDILVRRSGANQQIFAAHHFWNQQEECFVIQISMLETKGLQLTLLPESMKWKSVFQTKPCLKLKNYIRGQPFAGEESGGRLALVNNNKLLLTVGDHEREGWNYDIILAQDESADYGKILEVDLRTGLANTVSIGHRNPQGLYIGIDGAIWSTEHGPQGGDELNLILRGKNYGWPLVSYGTDYGKKSWPLSEHQGSHAGYEKPIYSWLPAIGVSNLIGIEGLMFENWKGDLIVSSLQGGSISRIRTFNGRLVLNERMEVGMRIRDLIIGKKGEIVLWGDSPPELVFIRPIKNQISGEVLFSQCIGCHSAANSTKNHLGPNLTNIVNRKIASLKNYDYSSALFGMGSKFWTEERLGLFLADPKAYVPGNSMHFDGIKDAESRKILIKYLKTM